MILQYIQGVKDFNMKLTEERVIPNLMKPQNGLLIEHIVRYEFASKFVKGRVLDIACGVGYGTQILLNGNNKDQISQIVGVDIHSDSIEYARENYSDSKAKYIEADAVSPELPDNLGQFDTIVSFETIEHLKEDVLFVENLKKLLKPEGTLIISTPFGMGRGLPCTNPYHIQQYKEAEFIELLKDFSELDMFYQRNQLIEKPRPNIKYYLMIAVCKGGS